MILLTEGFFAARRSLASLPGRKLTTLASTRRVHHALPPTPPSRQNCRRASLPCNPHAITKRFLSDKQKLSRTERRKLERRERNRSKRGAKASMAATSANQQSPNTSSSWMAAFSRIWKKNDSGHSSRRIQRLAEAFTPRMPLRSERMDDRAQWIALAYRLPLFLGLCHAFTDERISPYVVRASLGPSMLPTIQFVGDVWLVETGAWRKAWRWLVNGGQTQEDPAIEYQVGDLVLWTDPKTQRVSCKRIVGVQGDTVKRYGEFVELYRHRADLGIVWPSDASARGLQSMEAFILELRSDHGNGETTMTLTMVVPANHVWLEGDCPLFSVDSRHYGPIPTFSISGRLVFRLWPWERQELAHDPQYSYLSSCWVSRPRPIPYPNEEPYLGKKFGFYRISKTIDSQQSEASLGEA